MMKLVTSFTGLIYFFYSHSCSFPHQKPFCLLQRAISLRRRLAANFISVQISLKYGIRFWHAIQTQRAPYASLHKILQNFAARKVKIKTMMQPFIFVHSYPCYSFLRVLGLKSISACSNSMDINFLLPSQQEFDCNVSTIVMSASS